MSVVEATVEIEWDMPKCTKWHGNNIEVSRLELSSLLAAPSFMHA